MAYTVSQLAKLAGVSVRTLHHYDHLGLLSPSARTPAGYRQYDPGDLFRLQQILFYKELDFPLKQIQAILDDADFDPLAALKKHREMLDQRAERLSCLLVTLDKTILMFMEDGMTLKDEELYEGFSKEQVERYQREAREMYDPAIVAESERRLRKLSKAQWQAVKDEGEAVARELAELADRDPGDPEVQALVDRHHAWIENFYPAPAEVYQGLGGLYASHAEFRAYYDKFRPGLADFMASAMTYYAINTLMEE